MTEPRTGAEEYFARRMQQEPDYAEAYDDERARKKVRHIEIWFEGGTDEEVEEFIRVIAETAHEHEPAGVDVSVSGALNAERPHWMMTDEDEDEEGGDGWHKDD